MYAAGSFQDLWLRRIGAYEAEVYRAQSLWGKEHVELGAYDDRSQ